jgi:hypothetical protein
MNGVAWGGCHIPLGKDAQGVEGVEGVDRLGEKPCLLLELHSGLVHCDHCNNAHVMLTPRTTTRPRKGERDDVRMGLSDEQVDEGGFLKHIADLMSRRVGDPDAILLESKFAAQPERKPCTKAFHINK